MATHEERERMEQFLYNLRDDLRFVVQNIQAIIPGYRGEWYASVEEAWEPLEGAFVVENEIYDDSNNEKLDQHGLTGSQLDLKLNTADSYREGFVAIRENWPDFQDLSDAVRGKIVQPVLSAYLGSIESLLDSILDAIGAGQAIHEFKDLIDQILPF